MFEWLTKPMGRSKPKTKELPKREASASVAEDKAPKPDSADSRRLFGLPLGRSKRKAKELPTGEARTPVVVGKASKPDSSDSRRLFGLPLGRSKRKAKELPTGEARTPVVVGKAPKPDSADSLRALLKTAIADAEQIATSIKMRAQAEAEAEAARIIAQARLEVDEIKGKAEIAAQREAEDILSEANRKAEIAEVEAKQKILQFLIRASEEVEKEIKEEYQKTYSRLSSSVQDLMNEGQNIEIELKDRVTRLLESQGLELKGFETMLLSTVEETAPPIETPAPAVTELKPDVSSMEKIETPIQPEAATVAEKIETPIQPEAATVAEKIETPIQPEATALEEKVETSIQPEATAVAEKVETPAQPEVAALKEKVETPVQPEAAALEKRETAPLELERQGLYTGEVELLIAPPVELNLLSRLYNYLQTVPELRILYTRGSWDQGTTIIVVLDNPLPLINIILETPGVKVIPESLEKEGVATGKSSSLLRGGEPRVRKKIKLTLKET